MESTPMKRSADVDPSSQAKCPRLSSVDERPVRPLPSAMSSTSMEVNERANLQPVCFVSFGAGVNLFSQEQRRDMTFDIDNRLTIYSWSTTHTHDQLLQPKAILVISCHWQEGHPTVMTTEHPAMTWSVSGIDPPSLYGHRIFPPPGCPEVAQLTRWVLEEKGFQCGSTSDRMYDMGVYLPWCHMDIKHVDIPMFQLSLMSDLNIERHLDLGEALFDLRKLGVRIMGYGFGTHGDTVQDIEGGSSRNIKEPTPDWFQTYHSWLHDILQNPHYTREDKRSKLIGCLENEEFRLVHPNTDRFLPLPVTLAAAGYAIPEVKYKQYDWFIFLNQVDESEFDDEEYYDSAEPGLD